VRITYDAAVDALYIRFLDTTVTTRNVSDGIAFDYDDDGNLAGIEVLEAGVRIGDRGPLSNVLFEEIGPGTLYPLQQAAADEDEEDD
jgi:uncharacterized protein YuzE